MGNWLIVHDIWKQLGCRIFSGYLEMPGADYPVIQYHIPEKCNPRLHSSENLRTHRLSLHGLQYFGMPRVPPNEAFDRCGLANLILQSAFPSNSVVKQIFRHAQIEENNNIEITI